MGGVQTNVGKKNETTDVYYYNKIERLGRERLCAREG